MKVGAYKIALGLAITVCVALAVVVGYLLLGRYHVTIPTMPRTSDGDPVLALSITHNFSTDADAQLNIDKTC